MKFVGISLGPERGPTFTGTYVCKAIRMVVVIGGFFLCFEIEKVAISLFFAVSVSSDFALQRRFCIREGLNNEGAGCEGVRQEKIPTVSCHNASPLSLTGVFRFPSLPI
jgi:hypothetical protein